METLQIKQTSFVSVLTKQKNKISKPTFDDALANLGTSQQYGLVKK